jgi:hypothetical protein
LAVNNAEQPGEEMMSEEALPLFIERIGFNWRQALPIDHPGATHDFDQQILIFQKGVAFGSAEKCPMSASFTVEMGRGQQEDRLSNAEKFVGQRVLLSPPGLEVSIRLGLGEEIGPAHFVNAEAEPNAGYLLRRNKSDIPNPELATKVIANAQVVDGHT